MAGAWASIRPVRAAPPTAAPLPPIGVGLNESPFGPSQHALDAVRRGATRLERYTGDEAASLVRQIAALEQVDEAQVLLGDILEPLGLFLGTRGGPGGEFLFSEPGFTALVDAARPVGGVGVAVPLDRDLANDLPGFSAKLSERTRAAFLVNPHNPSGTVSDPSAFKAAVGALARRTLVIVDEAYLEYTDDGSERSCAELTRRGEAVVVFRTFSKIHGLASLPFGYALAPRELAEALRARGVGAPRSLNRLAVVAAAASLRDTAHVVRVRREVARERGRWHHVLDELGLRHSDARANFVYFEGRPQPEVAAFMDARGIAIGRPFPPLLSWTRISIGTAEENRRVQAALRTLLGR